MSKKPLAYRGFGGGVTYESAHIIIQFLINEADMDDDLTTVEYYRGMLAGLGSVRNGEIFSRELEREIKAYGIETIEHPSTLPRDDRGPSGTRTDGDQDRPTCAQ